MMVVGERGCRGRKTPGYAANGMADAVDVRFALG